MLTGEMHGLLLLQCVAVAMLILANGFFVAAEFALVSIRDTRIEQMLTAHVPGSRAVRRLQSDLDDYLPAVQLGVTLCSLAAPTLLSRSQPRASPWQRASSWAGCGCCRTLRSTPTSMPI